MQIQMTGRHVEITQALREFTENKLGRLESHFHNITNIQVTFAIESNQQVVEAKINIPGSTVVAKAESGEMYSAIDGLVDKLVRQLKRLKEKETERR